MSDPIKLTDLHLSVLRESLSCDPAMLPEHADAMVALVRTLRDRAKAVVGSSGEPFLHRKCVAVGTAALNALREVLP